MTPGFFPSRGCGITGRCLILPIGHSTCRCLEIRGHGGRERGLLAALGTGIITALPLLALLLVFFPGTSWSQLGPHDWIKLSWSVPLLPGLVKWLTGFAPQNQFYLLPVLVVAAVIAFREKNPWRAAGLFFFTVFIFSPANHAWYFTWFIAVAACRPDFGWSARLVGVSAFTYFWVLYVNATQGAWVLSPSLTALLWLPFVLPPLLAVGWRWLRPVN